MANKGKAYAFDATNREIDTENGYLRVSECILSRESVDPYYGYEVPGATDRGLDLNEVYFVYRPADELAKGIESFYGVPLLIGHHEDSADDPRKDERVGAVMNDVRMEGGDMIGSISVMDAEAIKGIEDGNRVCLSSAYTYTPVLESGEWQGVPYSIRMTDIHGNHVALVEEGRVKGAMVADEKPQEGTVMSRIKKALNRILAKDESELEKRERTAKEEFGIESKKGQREYAEQDKEDDTELAEEVKAKELLSALDELMGKARDDENAMESFVEDFCEFYEGVFGDRARDEENVEVEVKEEIEDDDVEERRHESLGKDIKDKAMDAALIMRNAKQQAVDHFRSLNDAVREMRPIIGDADPFSFKSADDIYKLALKKSGVKTAQYPSSAYRGMAEMLVEKANNSLAQDWAITSHDVPGMPDRIKNIKKGLV